MKVLIIGYGNPGRLDDGLGPALAERFQCLDSHSVAAQKSFQGLEKPLSGAACDVQALDKGRAGGTPAVRATPALTVESNYQLNVEDAAQIAEHDVVIFADAAVDAEPPFSFKPVEAEAGGLSFSSHSVSAPQLMGMVKELFGAEPQAYMLAIRGVEFNEFGEELSAEAQTNLNAAAEFLERWIAGKLVQKQVVATERSRDG